MTETSYFFFKVADRHSLTDTATALSSTTGIDHWEAVDGYYQAVARCNGDGSSCLDKFQTLGEKVEFARCRITYQGRALELDRERSHSYLLMEIDRQRADALSEQLNRIDGIAYWAMTDGPCNVIAIVEQDNFDAIDRLVEDHVAPLDGLLRFKQIRVLQHYPLQD